MPAEIIEVDAEEIMAGAALDALCVGLCGGEVPSRVFALAMLAKSGAALAVMDGRHGAAKFLRDLADRVEHPERFGTA